MTLFLHIFLGGLALWMITGTAINFSTNPHWYVRLWDFPRVFIMVLAALVGVGYAFTFHNLWWEWAMIGGLIFVIVRQAVLIRPYTMLAHKDVQRADRPAGDSALRLVISNVKMENDQHARWLEVVRAADADVIVAVEVDAAWDGVLLGLSGDYPHHLRHPQENYYGMAIYSRLPFVDRPQVRFLVQDDIPSAHVRVRLGDGQAVAIHALHPRPPEPIRDEDSAARDAELITMAREIGQRERAEPAIVCGDLNDVAWSYTTQLFLRISGTLDPRKGRGAYSSFDANSHLMRFPLDHVFHTNEFKLIHLRRLAYVGSDHFPMMIELDCCPKEAQREQPQEAIDAGDISDADTMTFRPAAAGTA